MIDMLYGYLEGDLVSISIVLLCALFTGAKSRGGIKITLAVGLTWPIAWLLCLYMVIKRRDNNHE